MPNVRGLWRRGTIYQYRVRVPYDLVKLAGRERINRSLQTGYYDEARRRARSVAASLEVYFDELRRSVPLRADSAPLQFPPGAERLSPAPISLAAAYEAYLSDPSVGRSPKTLLAYRTVSKIIISIIGAETALHDISRQTCRDVLIVLSRLPTNAQKRWPGCGAREAVQRADEAGLPPMSAANANALMNKFCALLNWAVKEEILGRNPARGLRIPDPIPAREKRKPFSTDQLRRIFGAPIYMGCQDDEAGYAVAGISHPRRARFWVPLVALFSGMRLNEICQMDVADVKKISEIDCFVVSDWSEVGATKQVKTASSERAIPIHPTLIEIGFLSYLRARRRAGDAKLFPELVLRYGLYSHLFSRWFARFLVHCGAAAEKTCFHSFRHNFRDAMREARLPRELAMALGGWTNAGSGGGSVADSYGSGYEAARLHEAICAIRYADLDLSHLLMKSRDVG